MPSSNGTGTARSVAKLYGSAATGGSDIGLSPNIFEALAKPAISPTNGLRDKVLQADTAFSLGFWKPYPKFVFGSSENAFGTPGARRLVRVRRSGNRHRIRLCNEPPRLPLFERSARTRPAPNPVPRHPGCQAADIALASPRPCRTLDAVRPIRDEIAPRLQLRPRRNSASCAYSAANGFSRCGRVAFPLTGWQLSSASSSYRT